MKITHDFHVHTSLSLCASRDATAAGYIERAKKYGLKKIGFSDHYWDDLVDSVTCRHILPNFPDPFYGVGKQNFEHVTSLLPELYGLRSEELEIFFGVEADYDPFHHSISVAPEHAEQFDFIIVPNSHTHMMMPKDYYEPKRKHIDYMFTALEDIVSSPLAKYITAIAHPFQAVCCPYGWEILMDMIGDDEYKRIFDKVANKNIAVEINVSSFMKLGENDLEQHKSMRLFRNAKDVGCKFIFGSDAHSHGSVEKYAICDKIADALCLKEDDIAEIAR